MEIKTLAGRPPIYREEQREKLRAASKFNAYLMDFIRPYVHEGMTTGKIDQLVHDETVKHGHVPACLGYNGFAKSCCTSINEVVCHGIPDGTILKDGDIVNVDLSTVVNGWYGDQSETFMIGEVNHEAKQLVQVTFEALWVGIRAAKPRGTVFDIGQAIYKYATKKGYSVVRQFQGHGIGQEFHQEPGVPHFPQRTSRRDILKPGTCFTIEPMINIGTWKAEVDPADGWTARTVDGMLSAQFEHQILMTENGPEVLTLTQKGPQEGDIF